MVADDPCCIEGGHLDNFGRVGVGMMLARPREDGLEKPSVAQPGGTAVGSQQPIVDREDLALFYPAWFFRPHLAKACRVSR